MPAPEESGDAGATRREAALRLSRGLRIPMIRAYSTDKLHIGELRAAFARATAAAQARGVPPEMINSSTANLEASASPAAGVAAAQSIAQAAGLRAEERRSSYELEAQPAG
jgi:hypothetical protein